VSAGGQAHRVAGLRTIALAVAWLFYLAFERHTGALRAAIRSRLRRSSHLKRATRGV